MSTVQREFVSLTSATGARNGAGFMPCQGLYHTPANASPKVAFIATHYNVDFSEHYLAEYMAARGYGYLGWNTRFRGNEAFFILEHALIDIGAGVTWLREKASSFSVPLRRKATTLTATGSLRGGPRRHPRNASFRPLERGSFSSRWRSVSTATPTAGGAGRRCSSGTSTNGSSACRGGKRSSGWPSSAGGFRSGAKPENSTGWRTCATG